MLSSFRRAVLIERKAMYKEQKVLVGITWFVGNG